MDLGLKDKVILISGGAKGIGKGIAVLLAKEGAIPVIAGRNENDNKATVHEMEKTGSRSFYVTAELSDPAACEKAVDIVTKHWGRLDGLVNNAGVNDGV